eukprot:gnl/TRDRNA2_/TRDRNA2_192462_c0_seq1.p1 gnl/TRDRNA2_/TRDRNA2_192462_c0~~gnl/TRDRNA2_/TRDRNA2_192462_c0_seq1.p1  ORF type:complete len:360 (+),score=52.55 gnl/TRDRNA2_/TRDRNA2_192462_c0_seq1:87-1082(+)
MSLLESCCPRRAPAPPCNRVLLTGASGLLGREVQRVLEQKGWIVRGLAFNRLSSSLVNLNSPLVKCDITDKASLAAQFEDFKPNIVFHCAAERQPDKLENDEAYATRINVEAATSVAKLSEAHGCWLIYMSTNYVFDGTGAPYKEDGKTNPLNTYGKSKLGGEQAVAAACPQAAMLRVPLLYGPIEKVGETSVTALLNAIKASAPKLDNWQERYPTSTEDVARVLESFAAKYVADGRSNPKDFRGIFHWQANEMHTKYTMALVIAEIAGIDTSNFIRVDDAPPPGAAPRPHIESMKCDRLEKLLGITPNDDKFRCDFKSCLSRHLKPFIST